MFHSGLICAIFSETITLTMACFEFITFYTHGITSEVINIFSIFKWLVRAESEDGKIVKLKHNVGWLIAFSITLN